MLDFKDVYCLLSHSELLRRDSVEVGVIPLTYFQYFSYLSRTQDITNSL